MTTEPTNPGKRITEKRLDAIKQCRGMGTPLPNDTDELFDHITALESELTTARKPEVCSVCAGSGALIEAHYQELLFAVERKFPNETRHQTALRYIKESERLSNETSEAMSEKKGEQG